MTLDGLIAAYITITAIEYDSQKSIFFTFMLESNYFSGVRLVAISYSNSLLITVISPQTFSHFRYSHLHPLFAF